MPKDNGGWQSIGGVPKEIRCPKCGNDHAGLLEITSKIYGKVSKEPVVLCGVCARETELDAHDSDK